MGGSGQGPAERLEELAARHREGEAPPDPEALDALARPPEAPWAARAVGLAFLVTAGSGAALALAFVLPAPTPLQGILLFLMLGSLGAALVTWSHRLLPQQQYVEQRHRLSSDPEAAGRVARAVAAERGISRRTILRWLGLLGLGGVATAFAAPVLSLDRGPESGERPGTGWRPGARLVDLAGDPVKAQAVPLGSIVTAFPDGGPRTALTPVILLHVSPDQLRLPDDRASWAPEGFIAFSKICTHAGCPVALYRATSHTLVCPCHQSTFEVLDGAVPAFGPAVRSLPQLPLELREDGTFAALHDFQEPVGPSTWNMPTGDDQA